MRIHTPVLFFCPDPQLFKSYHISSHHTVLCRGHGDIQSCNAMKPQSLLSFFQPCMFISAALEAENTSQAQQRADLVPRKSFPDKSTTHAFSFTLWNTKQNPADCFWALRSAFWLQAFVLRNTTHLRVHALHLVLLQLKLHKVVNDVEQLRRDGLEVLVVVVFDCQRGEDGVVDERRAQVGQHAWRVLPRVFVKVLCYEVV